MRIGFLILGVFALTVGVNGQSGVQTPTPEATWNTRTLSVGSDSQRLPDDAVLVYSRVNAEGVEIRIGNSVILADGAEVARWAGSTGPVEIKLTGHVVLKTVLDVHQKQYSR